MIACPGLFERLGSGPRISDGRSPHDALQTQVAAIKVHLEHLLNTRQGCSQSSPDLGLSDFNSHLGGADLVGRIAADIRQTLERYEPRLDVLGLHFRANPQRPVELSFRLDCRVRLHRHDQAVQIDLTVDHRHAYVK